MAILTSAQLVSELSKLQGPLYVMLVGLVGSGKSTVGAKLSWTRFVVLSTDDIVEEHAKRMGLNYTQAFQKVSQSKVKGEYNARLQGALADRMNILVDQTNLTATARSKKLRQVPDFYTKVCVIVAVSEPERERRLQSRGEATGKWIPQHVQEQMLRSYMTPSRDEGFDKLFQVQG